MAHALLGASIYGVRTAAVESSCSWSTSSVVRGYHVYKNVWTPSIGERLQLRRQDHKRLRPSCRERREGIVGHVPREMSRTFWHFIMHGGSVGCEITGRRTLGKGGGGGINEGGRIHNTNSFDVEK